MVAIMVYSYITRISIIKCFFFFNVAWWKHSRNFAESVLKKA